MNVIICGFLRSGVHLVSNSFHSQNGEWNTRFVTNAYAHWDESLSFLGLSPKENQTNLLQELGRYSKDQHTFFPCFFHPKYWNNELSNLADNTRFIFVYRPIEQVVDSITRHGVKEIYLGKKGLARMFSLRKFNKSLASLQHKVKDTYIDYYLSMIDFIDQNKQMCYVIRSAHFTAEFPDLIAKVSERDRLGLTPKSDYFKEDAYNNMKEITAYREEGLNKIHQYFSA